MSILKELTAKPWLSGTQGNVAAPHDQDPLVAARLALQLLLAVMSVLFLLFIITYLSRSQYADWQPLTGGTWRPLSNPWPLWLNSAVLLISSLVFEYARRCARKQQAHKTLTGFILASGLAIAFLIGQLWVWQTLMNWGHVVSSNPATSFFYLLTGIHGLHLIGGLVACGLIALRMLRGQGILQLRLNLELCAIYWHFLLVVWLLLFMLLASSPETYEAIAALCGFR